MKKIRTTLQKEIEYYDSIFTKEEIEDCFNMLILDNLLTQVDDSDEYELNTEKIDEIIKDYEKYAAEQEKKYEKYLERQEKKYQKCLEKQERNEKRGK